MPTLTHTMIYKVNNLLNKAGLNRSRAAHVYRYHLDWRGEEDTAHILFIFMTWERVCRDKCGAFLKRGEWVEPTAPTVEVTAQGTFTSKIRSREPSMSLISVCAEDHQQRVALWDEKGRLLAATPSAQQGVCLTVPVINCNRVVLTLVRQTVALFQVHDGEKQFDAVPGCESDAPVAVDVVWVDVWEKRAGEVIAHSWQDLLAFTCQSTVDMRVNFIYIRFSEWVSL